MVPRAGTCRQRAAARARRRRSVGVVDGEPVLDLDYAEDSACDTDMNVVMTAGGAFVEVQGTAEGAPFSRAEMDALVGLAERGIRRLVAAQKAALGA